MVNKLLKISALTSLFFILFTTSTFAQTEKESAKKDKSAKEQKVKKVETDELMTIVGQFYNRKLTEVDISVNGKDFKKQKFEVGTKTDNDFNFNPLILIVNEYIQKDWKLVDSNIAAFDSNSQTVSYAYYVLKRKVKSE